MGEVREFPSVRGGYNYGAKSSQSSTSDCQPFQPRPRNRNSRVIMVEPERFDTKASRAWRLATGQISGRRRISQEQVLRGQVVQLHGYRFIGLSVFGSRIQAKDHGLGTVQQFSRVLYSGCRQTVVLRLFFGN